MIRKGNSTLTFYHPRPSYEERPPHNVCRDRAGDFNPRPSYEERLTMIQRLRLSQTFQSTPLIRGATENMRAIVQHVGISIHAPHTRSDLPPLRASRRIPAFQSTPLIRGATLCCACACFCDRISIHAPHTRSDTTTISRVRMLPYFNPRPSYEERRPPAA